MSLVRSGWLLNLLTEAATSHKPEQASRLLGEVFSAASRRVRARAYLRRILRETGLLFGTPAQPTSPASNAKPAIDQLLLAVVATYARIALDIAALLDAPPGRRPEQVLLLLAVLVGEEKLAEQIEGAPLQRAAPVRKNWWSRVEAQLEKRATSVSGDPAYGLILHNTAVYADAQVFGRQAIDFFARGRLVPEAAERRLDCAARQKALLAKVLIGLACVERQPNLPAQRAILRQMQELQLPWNQRWELRRDAKTFFTNPPMIDALAQQVHGSETRRFVLEQTILASLVDGSRSPREVAFIRRLALQLKCPSKSSA